MDAGADTDTDEFAVSYAGVGAVVNAGVVAYACVSVPVSDCFRSYGAYLTIEFLRTIYSAALYWEAVEGWFLMVWF
jgi:hypothetical protein